MIIQIDFNSDEAIYLQLRNQIIMGIATSQFREGDALPSVRQLAEVVGETGRKLDFLVQELNREVNTMGSKASDADITQWVVDAKSEIEKVREQVQNVE